MNPQQKLPHAESIGDLFATIETRDWRDRSIAQDRGKFYLSTHRLNRPECPSCYVTLTPELEQVMKDNMILGPNEWHFEAIQRDDGSVLITANYSSILGSRWLKIFKDMPDFPTSEDQ